MILRGNGAFILDINKLRLALERPKTAEAFDSNGFTSATFSERIVLKTLRFLREQLETEAFEKGEENSVKYCCFHQRFRAV